MTNAARLLEAPIDIQPGERQTWSGLPGSAAALAIRAYTHATSAASSGAILVVTADSAETEHMLAELRWWDLEARGQEALTCVTLPDWETLAYDAFSPHEDIVSERLRTLDELPKLRTPIVVVPIRALLQKLAPPDFVRGRSFSLGVGERFDAHTERSRLEQSGYRAVDVVHRAGEFAIRGALMDIFPMGAETAIRIDLFDDEIESLRVFDPSTQRTIDRLESIRLLPAKEFPLDPDAIARFKDRWHRTFDADIRRCSVYQDVSHGLAPGGIEYFQPLFFETMGTLFHYLPDIRCVFRTSDLERGSEDVWHDVVARYESLRHDTERPILHPDALFLRTNDLLSHLKPLRNITLAPDGPHRHDFGMTPLPDLAPTSRTDPFAKLRELNDDSHGHALVLAESPGRAEILADSLRTAGIANTPVDHVATLLSAEAKRVGIAVAPNVRGFVAPSLAVIPEFEFAGQKTTSRTRDPRSLVDPDKIIRNLTELREGAPVVHMEHGIGRYRGLTTLEIDGNTYELLVLEYADEATLYVPVTSLQLISRYAGADEALAPLHRLGSDQWEKAKRKAAEQARDAAAELLDVYARRQARTAFQFELPADDYARFAADFQFALTADQERAIDDCIDDLCSPNATDRLICGDVGFGKTEVAMRAAFVAAQNSRQVAILVPTTLLAQQHFDTFRDRFAGWPVQIDLMSRLRTTGENDEVLARLRRGATDIVIGTHKLLAGQTQFKNLGLVIIDEEHRFGVRQKERLKSLRAEVDVITLTATPIPRTLNLAVSGLRDLSIIATPPARRLAIQTFVQPYRRHVVREAIARELARGGQVFYLHNEVRTIESCARAIADAVPEARTGIGHGQMPKHDLEHMMADFYHRQINVLVCTTIIENGIDVPNANTIVIERADKFGLAQLHQLRGRVGRSHRQAYAYLLTPEPKAMTADAQKRLEAISEAGDLGVGFTLATHDLEIRGAGELLGEEQSGQIQSIGFSLYMELLDRAVQAIRAGVEPDIDSPLEPTNKEVNLHSSALIDATYLPDVHTRLLLYKRISNAADTGALDDLRAEMIDRFGALPEATQRLFRISGLKLETAALNIVRLDLGEHGGKLEFAENTSVDPLAVVNLIQSAPSTYRMDGAATIRITSTLPDFETRMAFAQDLLARLRPTASIARAS